MIGILGDIHGDFESTVKIMEKNSVDFWLGVGDVASDSYEYFTPPAPFYWISGNNEDWDLIEEMDKGEIEKQNLHHLKNGEIYQIDNLRIIGLGGTFSKNFYNYKRKDLPHPKNRDFQKSDRRRHFVEEEVESCKNAKNIDIFLSHEASMPFKIRGIEAGKWAVNYVIKNMKPKIHFFGHHHIFSVKEVNGISSVCLDKIPKSFVLLDVKDFSFERICKL
ncbi:MAG: metallophosphoesterase [Thermoplasmatales archaeon]|nr:metallophosphoesterase [Thermoplasmatales archaeon]